MTKSPLELRTPYLLFLGDVSDDLSAKTARGILEWRPEQCVGQFRLSADTVSLGLDDLTPQQAVERGAQTLIVGVANPGGRIPDHWTASFTLAVDAGLDVANALHRRLASLPGLADHARASGVQLLEVRDPAPDLPIGNGKPRTGKRLLTVGTDCSIGKMYTALAMERAMLEAGMRATFRATGQTGIFITGSGVPLDAVPADFISGAIEEISPDNDADHWDLIEGQGSLFHPSFAGVSLGLLHGAQADALVMCHEPTRTHMRGQPHQPLPDMKTCMETNVALARLTNPDARIIGFAVNTKALSEADAHSTLRKLEDEHGMPAVDPVRTGVAPLVAALDG